MVYVERVLELPGLSVPIWQSPICEMSRGVILADRLSFGHRQGRWRRPAGTVTGRVLDGDGQPRHDVRIGAGYVRGQFGRRHFPPFLDATPGDDGRFRIEGLIPGVAYDLIPRSGNRLFVPVTAGLKLREAEARDLGDVRAREAGQ